MSGHRPTERVPAWTALVGAQLRLLFRRRPPGLIIAGAIVALQIVLLASVGIVLGIRIEVGHEQGTTVLWSRIGDFADELEFPLDEGVAAVAAVALAAAIWGFCWPFRVWGEESVRRRAYHWAMPVERRRHDLLRVGVGAAALPAIVLAFVLLALAIAALFGNAGGLGRFDWLFWLDLLVAPVIVYLLASIPTVGALRPAAWLWGSLGALAALFSLSRALPALAPIEGLLQGLSVGPFGLLTTIGGPVIAQIGGLPAQPAGIWLAAALGWLLVGAAGVLAAASRRSKSI